MPIRTRLLLLSDTHTCAPNASTATSYAYRWPLQAADVAIHTGDLTMTGTIAEHEGAVDMLKSLPAALKIVIPGNHDLTLDQEYYATTGELHGPRPKYNENQLQYIRDLYTGPDAQASNIAYLEEGRQTFELENGASLTIHASAYTPEFCEGAFAYPREQNRFDNPDAANPVPCYHDSVDENSLPNIDVVVTHGPPYGILDETDREKSHVGCQHLLRAVARSKPLLHCFGHIHEGWGAELNTWSGDPNPAEPRELEDMFSRCRTSTTDARLVAREMAAFVDGTRIERGRETLFVNSSIMDVTYDPVQGPWVVDLELPATSDARGSPPTFNWQRLNSAIAY